MLKFFMFSSSRAVKGWIDIKIVLTAHFTHLGFGKNSEFEKKDSELL